MRPLCNEDGIKIKDKLSMARKLNKYFTIVFNKEDDSKHRGECKMNNGNDGMEMDVTRLQ